MKLVDREKAIAELSETLADECTLGDMRNIVLSFVERELDENTDDELILLGEDFGYEYDVEFNKEEQAAIAEEDANN